MKTTYVKISYDPTDIKSVKEMLSSHQVANMCPYCNGFGSEDLKGLEPCEICETDGTWQGHLINDFYNPKKDEENKNK